MSRKGVIVGSILGGLAILGIVAVITFIQLQHSDERQPKDPSVLQSGSPLETEDQGSGPPTGQISELEAFAEAVQALEQAQQVIAGRCASLLALPIDVLFDVVKACSVSPQLGFKPS